MNLMNIALGDASGITGLDTVYFSFTSDLFPEEQTYTLISEYKNSIPFGNANLPKDIIILLRDFCNKVLNEVDAEE